MRIRPHTGEWNIGESPPFEGGVAATSIRCREAAFDRSGRGGKSMSYHPDRAFKGGFAFIFLMAQPPLLQKEGTRLTSPKTAMRSAHRCRGGPLPGWPARSVPAAR